MFFTKGTPAVSPVDAAKAEIVRTGEQLKAILAEREAKRTALATAERAAGEAYLDQAGATDAIEGVIRIKTELDAIGRAAEVLHTRRLTAIEQRFRVEAGELRRQAAEKRRELEELEAKASKHLEALAQLEGAMFGTAEATNSMRLKSTITDLESRARELEYRQVPNHGTVDLRDATSTDDLVAAVLQSEAAIPRIEEIRQWAADAQSERDFGSHPRRFYLVWRNGAIDPEVSYIFCAALARPLGGASEGIDVRSATFRAPAAA